MKIVFLAPFGIRPKGTLIARMLPLAVELQALGHKVVIIAPPHTNPEDAGKTDTKQGVTIRNVRLGPRWKVIEALGVSWRMFRATEDEQPDIVHLFKPKGFGGIAAMLMVMLKRCGGKRPDLFVDMDDWEGRGGMNDLLSYSTSEKWLFQLQEDWLPPHAVGVTVASRTLQTKAWGMGGAPRRVLYLPNCVDDIPAGEGMDVRRRLGIPAEAPVLLIYTRFFEFEQKKLHHILEQIYQRVPNVRFLVIGKGRNLEEELLVEAGQVRGFGPALVMGGWLAPADIPSYLAAGDVAIYPFRDTLINRSKCPAKLTEILRAGVAVVADGVGQISEYVKSGVSGVLCDPDDWDEMVRRAADLLLDPAKRRTMGEAGRRYMLERFAWSDAVVKLEKFYQRTTNDDRP